ncbi:methyl-accepting chemotaxis protein [Paenibacillus sp. GD4]|uniref:methyl-accepting chemotaxis protein n=1 Tax=Paenibacillus sp. GD4 TaxID=3068890 RepID=UPI00279692C9|nr:methyl-accepting chemotaxis protein [Paenibacillus sp. GD4]MDQ1912008.1 methyl-accepting chemotaxis protein [Paenibacillus sp. GD4]
MSWFQSLSIKKKLQFGCYTLVALYSLALLFLIYQAEGSKTLGFTFLILMLALSFPIIRFLERALTDPISDISRVALNIAKGDFSQKVPVNSNDALGELAESFNRMMDKLREILKDTGSTSKHVFESSRDIYFKNESLRSVLEQVSVSSGELAAGANQISEEIVGVSMATKDIEQKVSSYTSATREMNSRSGYMIELVEKGLQAVEIQSAGMKKNVEATANVSHTIDLLAKQTNGISQITRSISDIAEQTNLLSLNASIEAARAGEHGKGFAVVAQQVRKLAEESTTSTKEVFSLVRNIEQGIQQALHHIAQNEQVVQEQTKLINETEAVFAQIVDSVKFISEQISTFAQESEHMLASAQQISGTMENISAITEQSAAGTEEVSSSMKEQISAVQEIVNRSEEMTKLVTQLQQMMSVFKL